MEYKLASSSWDEREINAINSVIEKNMFTMGESVSRFEKDFSKFFDSKFTVMVSSGSTANLLAVASLFFTKNPKLKPGDEVIVPAVSWSTTYFPLQQYGLKLKFVDIDINTLNYDLDMLEKAISISTKMIVVVNLLGNPNNFDKINDIISGKDIFIIEDNCESMGATFENKYAGTFGLLGTFSTFFSHHMTTMEGGLIVTDDEELYHILLCIRAHGWTRNLPKINKVSNKTDDWFTESFRFVLPGYNVRPLEMSGAIGIEQLKKLPTFIENRRKNAKLFVDLFGNHPDFIIQHEIGKSSWFGFSLIIKKNSTYKRKVLVNELIKANIECRPIVTVDFTQNEVLKNAKYLHNNGLFVGNQQNLIFDEIKYLYDIIKKLKSNE